MGRNLQGLPNLVQEPLLAKVATTGDSNRRSNHRRRNRRHRNIRLIIIIIIIIITVPLSTFKYP